MVKSLIEGVVRYWYSFRLRMLIARDTTEIDRGDDSLTDISDMPDG